MAKFTVDVYGDTICPWCYIGKASLDAAIAQHKALYPDDTFELRWKPFLLYPNAKISAYNKQDAIAVRFGPDASAFLARVAAAGAPYGLTFDWSGRTGSTADSHKLLLLAGDLDRQQQSATTPTTTSDNRPSSPSSPEIPPGPAGTPWDHPSDPRPETSPPSRSPTRWTATSPPRDPTKTRQDALLSALFAATLSHGQDVSSRAFLVPLAVAHGLGADAAAVEAYLDGGAAGARVEREAAAARFEAGVTAVPSYVVNGRYRVGGWQEPGVFGGVFGRIREAAEKGKGGGGGGG